jgi:dienelactone hydrolase
MSPFKLKSVRKKLQKLDLNNDDSNFSLQPFVKKWIEEHPPEMSYLSKASTLPFKSWKKQIHDLISTKINVLEPLPLNEQRLAFHGEAEANGIKFIKLSIMALPNIRVPAILCIPSNIKSKTPAVITIHGHYPGCKERITGLRKSKGKTYFGYELAQKGLITLSLDWIGGGERESFWRKNPLSTSYEGQRSNWLRFLGLDMIGLRITEIKAFLDYLETREEVDKNRFGVMGHSGGGTLSLFTSVLDDRIKVCATSGYFGTWEHSILGMYHCGCNYSGDLGKYLEMYDVYASLAPLPLAICTGKKDKIYPVEGTNIAIPIIKKAYEEVGSPDNFIDDVHPKGHMFRGDKIYPFILNHI